MKTIVLFMNHERHENGKPVLYKAGQRIEVSDEEYEQIVMAVKTIRADFVPVDAGPTTPKLDESGDDDK